MSFDVTVLTMFPEAFPGPISETGLRSLETVDIRGFSKDKRGFLHDPPAGGGPGQVMRADVIASALDSVEVRGRPLLCMSARGRPLTQARVRTWASGAGGEAAALVAIEACVRLVPGVLGQAQSLSEESFEDGLLEHPQYTRPRTFEGLDIPEVLLSGNHAVIRKWRQGQREETTRQRRPDLWAARTANQQAKG